jgi:hypothetical protein
MDETESFRRAEVARINSVEHTREELEAQYGQVWDTDQLCKDFDVQGFMTPYVVVRRKSDGKKGSLEFVHSPRFFYSFTAD